MKMKETTQPIPQGYEKFDLQRALSGDKVVTRDGREVTGIYRFRVAGQCVAAAINDSIETYWESGRYCLSKNQDSEWDLFMAPKPAVKYVNVYLDGSLGRVGDSIDCVRGSGTAFTDKQSICRLEILNGEVVKAETVHRYQ